MANGRRGRKPSRPRASRKPVPFKRILQEIGFAPTPSVSRAGARRRAANYTQTERSAYPLKVPAKIRRIVPQRVWNKAAEQRLEKQRINTRAKSGMPVLGWEKIVEISKKLTPGERREAGQELRNEIIATKKKINESVSQINKITGRNLTRNPQFVSRVRNLLVHGMYLSQLQMHELANAMPHFESQKLFTPKTRALFIRRMMEEEKQVKAIQEILLNEEQFKNVARKMIRQLHEK